jgi:hypothetical protein
MSNHTTSILQVPTWVIPAWEYRVFVVQSYRVHSIARFCISADNRLNIKADLEQAAFG